MIEVLFELGINLIETLIVIDFVTRYLGMKYKGKYGVIAFVAAWMVYFSEMTIINYITFFEGIAIFIPVFLVLSYELVFLKGSIWLKIWISVLSQIIITIIALGLNLFVCYLIKYDPIKLMTTFNMVRVLTVIIAQLLLYYITRFILRHRYNHPIDKNFWYMLIIIPIISIVSLIALMFAAMKHDDINGYIICGMVGIIAADIVTYYFFTALNKDYEMRLRIGLLEQSYENAQKNIESAKAYVQEIRTVRHDMDNLLSVIQGYMNKGRFEDAERYLNDITMFKLPALESYVNTENEAFNAVVNSKIAICNQKNIFIEIKTMKDCLKEINALDIGVLFGNLIDNAIEATENSQERKISVDVGEKGAYLSVLITNSIDESVLEKNSGLKTTKEEKNIHGIGIRSIKNIVKKYDGMIQFYEEYGEFCCHILLDRNEKNVA